MENMNHISQINTYLRTNIKGFDLLVELALNLRWTWKPATDKIWQALDSNLWELTENPWVILHTVSQEKVEALLSDSNFSNTLKNLVEENRQEAKTPSWFQKEHAQSRLTSVAYFSMEFMLSEALPIYSGGLGNVAGDQLKAASDLGVPVIAIGLLYQQGYFRQIIDQEGKQQALYPYNSPVQLPITPLRKANGEWLRIEIKLPGYSLFLRTWQVQVGRVKLYLLDSNDAANFPAHRGITSELYGGDSELRLKQELILGIGGWRLLEALGQKPEVCHLNEGHAAFAILERTFSFMKESGLPFDAAFATVRAGNLFTTHTAVPAGFDRFSPHLIELYLAKYAKNQLGLSLEELLALGRLNPKDQNEEFNMAYLAVRGSGAVNGVSRLHGKVSQHIFSSLFPRMPEEEVPIGYVTNGVHFPSWESDETNQLWTKACGKERWCGCTEELENDIRKIPTQELWRMRNQSRRSLIEFANQRLTKQLEARGALDEVIEQTRNLFNPNIMTLGFARRFATYKRPNMLLHDPSRLLKILSNPERPVQLIIAGKAHPADLPGQALIREWIQFIRRPEVRHHIMFLADYDMNVTNKLVQGVDVWINTPLRPWEACGTSGMKVLANGGINCSELDGWWVEAYTPKVGWALGDGQEHGYDPAWTAAEAATLYDLLEYEIIPEFYARNKDGIPERWIERMCNSMADLTPHYSANRAVREYTEKYYLPAAEHYRQRAANRGAEGKVLVEWQHMIDAKWNGICFGEVKIEQRGNQLAFTVSVDLNGLNPAMVKVELFANAAKDHPSTHQQMTCLSQPGDGSPWHTYESLVPAEYPADYYTPRILPCLEGVAVPVEINRVLWQR